MENYINNVSSIIFNTLVKYNPVYLPTIGSLKIARIAASLSDDHKFTAPRYTVEYNNDVCENPVIDLISNTNHVEKQQAEEIYNGWLNNIVTKTDNSIRYNIENVGVLNLYPEGAAIFTVSERLSPYLNPFDMETDEPFYQNEEIQQDYQESEKEGEEPHSDNDTNHPETQTETPPPYVPTENKPRKNANTQLLILILIGVVIVLGAIIAALIIYSPKSSPIPPVQTEKTIPPAKSDSSQDSLKIKGQTATVSSPSFHIIAGAFINKDLAEKYTRKLQNEGTDAEMIYSSSKELYLVSIYRFQTYPQALQKLNQLPFYYPPYSYWIWEEEK